MTAAPSSERVRIRVGETPAGRLQDELLQAPPGDLTLWRYLTPGKFLALITSRTLWFARLDLLGDPFEGSSSAFNVANRGDTYPEFNEWTLQRLSEAFRATQQRVFASCWHASDYESEAMWRLYAPGGEGVAVKTTAGKLASSCDGWQPSVHVAAVRYIDYETEWMPEGKVLYPALHKRLSFEHEREVRALFFEPDPPRFDLDQHTAPRVAGYAIPVELTDLLIEVRVAPTAPSWLFPAVEAVLGAFGGSIPLAQSDLDRAPSW